MLLSLSPLLPLKLTSSLPRNLRKLVSNPRSKPTTAALHAPNQRKNTTPLTNFTTSVAKVAWTQKITGNTISLSPALPRTGTPPLHALIESILSITAHQHTDLAPSRWLLIFTTQTSDQFPDISNMTQIWIFYLINAFYRMIKFYHLEWDSIISNTMINKLSILDLFLLTQKFPKFYYSFIYHAIYTIK